MTRRLQPDRDNAIRATIVNTRTAPLDLQVVTTSVEATAAATCVRQAARTSSRALSPDLKDSLVRAHSAERQAQQAPVESISLSMLELALSTHQAGHCISVEMAAAATTDNRALQSMVRPTGTAQWSDRTGLELQEVPVSRAETVAAVVVAAQAVVRTRRIQPLPRTDSVA
jgi:hypothetical protein